MKMIVIDMRMIERTKVFFNSYDFDLICTLIVLTVTVIISFLASYLGIRRLRNASDINILYSHLTQLNLYPPWR